MSELVENSEPLIPPPAPTPALDLVEVFTSFLIIPAEINKLLELKVDQRGIDFILMLLDKSPDTLRHISSQLHTVLQDGVLNTDDVPVLINMVKDVMNTDRNKIAFNMLSVENVLVFIKTVLELLIIKNYVKVINKEKIFALIDVSFTLLTTSLDTNVKCVDCVKRLFQCV
jgi:hypothetical protein